MIENAIEIGKDVIGIGMAIARTANATETGMAMGTVIERGAEIDVPWLFLHQEQTID